MIFNVTEEINGKQSLTFTKKDDGIIITLYKQPAWNKTEFPKQHGIVENDDITPDIELDTAYDAPSDWTFIVEYSFGPDSAQFETKSDVVWYKLEDRQAIEKLWYPTNTYYQDFVNCTSKTEEKEANGVNITHAIEGSLDICQNQKPTLPFVSRCCPGSIDGGEATTWYWCIPNTFHTFQPAGKSLYQGLTVNCPWNPSEN